MLINKNLLRKELSNFKKIEIDYESNIDDSTYNQLSKLLKRIGRSEQKSTQIYEILKDEITSKLSKYDSIIEKVKEQNAKQEQYFKMLEKGLINYFDIIDNVMKDSNQFEDQSFIDLLRVMMKAMKQINDRIGIIEIPGNGAEIDLDVHYVISTEITSDKASDNKVKEVIQKGYRIGERLVRKATIIGFKYGEKDEK